MLAAERGASVNTLAAYRRDLQDFRNQVGTLADASADDVRTYLGALSRRGDLRRARRRGACRRSGSSSVS